MSADYYVIIGPSDWTFNNMPTSHLFDRGFTGHEYLDEFNLINMNGRIYDQTLGRFLSPDNYIQNPEQVQSYNRYSYALNNPLTYVDPSGQQISVADYHANYIHMSYSRYAEEQGSSGGGGSRGGGSSGWGHGSSGGSTGGNSGFGSDAYEVGNADIKEIIDAINNGFGITIVDAYGRVSVVISVGNLNTQVSENGGLFSYNPSASYFSIPTTSYQGGKEKTAAHQLGGYFVNPTGMGIRNDAGGDGHWHAPRGNRPHEGIDFSSIDGQDILSPINGRAINSSFINGKGITVPTVVIIPSDPNLGFNKMELLYTGPVQGGWRNVNAGDIIGQSVNLQMLGYPSNVGPHIHLQIKLDRIPINPTPYFDF